jgi:hypothetical protein
MKVRMRDDLAEDGLAIPASRTFKDYDTQVDVVNMSMQKN